jgi:hypothetical protein
MRNMPRAVNTFVRKLYTCLLPADTLRLVYASLVISVALAQSSPEGLRTYQDPRKRFQFTYPDVFGSSSPGTDNGFRNRTAAIRFSDFSSGVHAGRIILGGEAVLTVGPAQLDLQAVGGLYDPITFQVFPARTATVVQSALPVLSAATLCDALGREQHVDLGGSATEHWSTHQRQLDAVFSKPNRLHD